MAGNQNQDRDKYCGYESGAYWLRYFLVTFFLGAFVNWICEDETTSTVRAVLMSPNLAGNLGIVILYKFYSFVVMAFQSSKANLRAPIK